jgi:hypothetical protein
MRDYVGPYSLQTTIWHVPAVAAEKKRRCSGKNDRLVIFGIMLLCELQSSW